jgi:biopolymer transport protein ExbD
MTTTNTLNINQLSLSAKRALLTELKESIKQSVAIQKNNKILIKANKEAEKKAKVLAQIKAAEDKLAKLQSKLAG